jgi:putative addiction module component (TIGR02574 family)
MTTDGHSDAGCEPLSDEGAAGFRGPVHCRERSSGAAVAVLWGRLAKSGSGRERAPPLVTGFRGAVILEPMTEKARALLEQALKLSPAERVKLANELWDSVDVADEGDEFDLSPEWREAIERRVEGILSGKHTSSDERAEIA